MIEREQQRAIPALAWQHAMAVKAFYEPWAWSCSGTAAASSGGSSTGQGTGR